jgi:hypothetical protein
LPAGGMMHGSAQEELAALRKDLMAQEIQMVEVLEELLQSFERSYCEHVEASKQLIMAFFTTVRDLEGTFHSSLVSLGQRLFDEKYNVEVWGSFAPRTARLHCLRRMPQQHCPMSTAPQPDGLHRGTRPCSVRMHGPEACALNTLLSWTQRHTTGARRHVQL